VSGNDPESSVPPFFVDPDDFKLINDSWAPGGDGCSRRGNACGRGALT
jgi:hypothetical protein